MHFSIENAIVETLNLIA